MLDGHSRPEPGGFRVAIVTEYYYPHLGGVTEHVHHFAAELRRRGHEADIITGRVTGTESEPGIIRVGRSVPIYSNASMARITLGSGLRAEMRALLAHGGYDIVHVHAPFSPSPPVLAIEEAAQPVVGTVHSWFPRSAVYRMIGQRLARLAERLDALIAVSPTAMHAQRGISTRTGRSFLTGSTCRTSTPTLADHRCTTIGRSCCSLGDWIHATRSACC
ncbi:MAG: glycosyltransferase family 4 protein [Gemmatimonadaceae bacterium]